MLSAPPLPLHGKKTKKEKQQQQKDSIFPAKILPDTCLL